MFLFFFVIQYPPPLVPPRGEVNAADAFDIGSFDEDDVKGIKVRLGKSDKLTYDCLFWLQALMKCKFKPRLFSYHVFANSYGSFHCHATKR